MTTGVIQGRDVLFYILGGSGYIPYYCAAEISIQTTAEKKSVKTIGDGAWTKYAYQSLGYSLTLNGVLKFDTSGFTGWDMIAAQTNFITVRFRAVFTSGSDVKRIDGEALIETSQLTMAPSNVVLDSYSLLGTGPYVLATGTGFCSAVITDVVKAGGGITFTANSDTAYISYTVTRISDGHVSSTGTVYATGFHASLIVVVSTYRIDAIPYCASDVPGAAFTKTITI